MKSATARQTPSHDLPPKERIYDAVRRAILVGEYPPGSFIEEERISTAHDVSRTPVREAFHRLHAEHYIALVPRRGAMVTPIGLAEFSGLFQARLMVEGAVIELACARQIRPSAAMRDALRRLQSFSSLRSPDEQVDYLAADWDFHAALVELSGNPVLQGMYSALRPHQERVGMTARPTVEDLHILDREHTALYDTLMKHDVESCKAWLARHLDTSSPRGERLTRL
ncbi:GntR family transcriptional regulator [Ameyamaea chiangmaiensis NBRC 103196]|uniref:GntR family transcriptional regulator n=1 Tax=Ameyamaea chiangmaiensis TaxID=442969 RepID=A0A850PGF1_9PROT|nr:GntR family transcriptional regulator [Ameyamaea chiangmaiensis]MBS4075556.1 GntR family transcriptional regulator [Ameyamaea chiangmaiensis]NVN40241.1 GntR family transcriptional regulator [Ameyamaea chiangmaiensis]GBQ69322.1 GntR family transcriptional regulator [Ameyamaea chiangmaiensis NBRC 103196]